ncbi:MAG: PAS domain S-box protein [Candidatus Accumulibacter sp.]|jgi:two-component system sensor histidine kinase HydH|nr:PAS domain S-box protein [Accumulibacter sp.]
MTNARKSSTPDAGSQKISACSRLLFGFSPRLVVGFSAILALAIALFAWRNTEREREHITQNFLDRADALVWALEAATRTEISLGEGVRILQKFVMETARRRGILYIAIVDEDGRVLAHSNPQEVGKILPRQRLPSAEPPKDVAWHTVQGSDSHAFEVYREFSPAPGYHHSPLDFHDDFHENRHTHGKNGERDDQSEHAPHSFAMIGFDNRPYEAILASDRFNNSMAAAVAVILALGSSFSLFWAEGYRRSRRLLKDTRALASEVVTNLPVGLITCDPRGVMGMTNETALAMLRMSRETVAGTPMDAVPGLDWKGIITTLSRNKKIIEHEMEFRVNGDVTPVSVSASQIRDEDGLFLGHLFILRDISEMKRLQAEARRNDKLAALGNLAAGVAHEIRNPLSSIKGIATFLAARVRSSEPEEEAAKTMISEADRLNRVVSQLLEFAKPGVMKLADANINEVVARALRLAGADIRAKKIHVVFDEDETLPRIPMNAERFTQALLNLFLNAVQAMKPGGTLEISIRPRDEENMCVLCVRDDGEGMSQEVLASIFTPYFTTKASGTGLGLAIVHQIIEGHGGGISVKSAPGSGSAFTLSIPMRRHHKEEV